MENISDDELGSHKFPEETYEVYGNISDQRVNLSDDEVDEVSFL